MQGNIHSYDTFGTVDGPGIRFVVFMQGCILQCKYCHNRDTWDFVKKNIVTSDELVEKILDYKDYFDLSGGGVTFSGGEPLCQQDFLLEILPKLKSLNIHTTIDTSGMFQLTDKIKQIIDYADLFMVDIKHIDTNKCLDICGMPNEKELEFIQYLDSINKPIWIRQVLIPGYTDNEEDLQNLKNFLHTLKKENLQKIEILPYESLGRYKWESMNLEYPFVLVREADKKDVKRAKEILGIDKTNRLTY